MRRLSILIMLILFAAILSACDANGETVLPTRVQIEPDDAPPVIPTTADVIGTPDPDQPPQEAIPQPEDPTATAIVSDTRPTLPPTWTPEPTPTPEGFAAVAQSAPAAQSAPEQTTAPSGGTLFFIYDDINIVALNPANGETREVLTTGAGRTISQIVLSPDDARIAFIAPSGAGNAREVWAVNVDGSDLRRVSCLNFGVVRHVAWHPNGEQVAFMASPQAGAPFNVYIAGIANSEACPGGNNQRLLETTASSDAGGLTFSPDGGWVFYSAPAIFGYNLTQNIGTPQLTQTVGAGADFNLRFAANDPSTLTYIRDRVIEIGRPSSGEIIGIDITQIDSVARVFEQNTQAVSFDYSRDGRRYVVITEDYVEVLNVSNRIGDIVYREAGVTVVAISPDGSQVAIVDGDPVRFGVEQIYLVNVARPAEALPLTDWESGLVRGLVWSGR